MRRQENRYNPIKQKASLLRTPGCVEPEASPSPTSISAPAFHSLSQLSALDQITVNIKTEQEVKPPMPACSVPPSYTHSSPKRWTTNRVCDTTAPASAEYSKPTFSYKELIMVAIVSDPTGAICLNDIYNNIRRFFPYFQQKTIGLTWQNSIRHNLSLNKCFRRLDNNGSGTPTKGGSWTFDTQDETWRRLPVLNCDKFCHSGAMTLSPAFSPIFHNLFP